MKLQLKGNWNQIKGKLKQKYGQLTDQGLTFAEGKEDELLGRLQKRLGRTKDQLRAEIEDMCFLFLGRSFLLTRFSCFASDRREKE